MNKYLYPLPKDKLDSYYENIVEYLRRGSNVFIEGLPLTGRSANLKFLTLHPDAEEIRKRYNDYKFIFIDNFFSEVQAPFWVSLAQQLGIQVTSQSTEQLIPLVHSSIQKLTRDKDKTLVLALNEPSRWEYFDKLFAESLIKLKNISKRQVYYLFIVNPLFSSISCDFDDFISYLKFQKITYKTFEYNDFDYIIRRMHKLYDSGPENITDAYIEKIFNFSGGIAGFIKPLLDIEKPIIDNEYIDQILDLQIIVNRLDRILNNIDEKNIKNLKSGEKFTEFEKFGLTDKKGEIKSLLLKNYINKYERGDSITLTMTPQEQDVFELLLANLNQLCTREDIARAMWGEDFAEKYSDWGIDSVISRIRKKQSKYDVKTIKGKGFVLK